MSLYAFILILIASFTHAGWNYLAKRSGGGLTFVWLVYATSTILFFPVVLLWPGMNFPLTVTAFILAFVSAALRLGYFIVLQTGYKKADLSVVYPVGRGSAPLLSALGAILLLGEKPTIPSAVGLALIIAGVLVISNPFSNTRDSKLQTGIFYGALTGLLIACYTLWDKVAVSEYNITPVALTFASNILGAVCLAPVAIARSETRAHIRQHLASILAIAVLSPVSYLLVLEAMKTTPVVYVAPARELSILFGVMMGGQLMNEKNVTRRLVASALILGGVAFLTI